MLSYADAQPANDVRCNPSGSPVILTANLQKRRTCPGRASGSRACTRPGSWTWHAARRRPAAGPGGAAPCHLSTHRHPPAQAPAQAGNLSSTGTTPDLGGAMVHAGLSAHHAPQHCWAIDWAAIYEEVLKQVLLGCLTPLKLPPRCEPPVMSTMQACLTISQATSAPLPSRTWQLASLCTALTCGMLRREQLFQAHVEEGWHCREEGVPHQCILCR